MPVLENAKKYPEHATGLGRPGKRKASELEATIPRVPPRKDPVHGRGGPLSKLWKKAK
jgi:hypothetical protein